MGNLRSELQRKASWAFVQYAIFRWEGAVIVAGTIVLAVFWPPLFEARVGPEWPTWIWPLLGIIGWGAIIFASMTDPDTSGKVMWQMLRDRLELDKIKDGGLRERAEAMCRYIRAVEADLYHLHQKSSGAPALEGAASRMVDWVEQGVLFAKYVDTYRRDHRLEQRRKEIPNLIETLVARLKYEKNPDIVARLNSEMEALGKDWASLKLLDAQMRQAESQLSQSLTALARATSELHVIAGERSAGGAHVDHLNGDIERHLGQITDLVTQMEQLYSDALDKG